MNTYQHRWLLAQALGTGVETAGGSSGSYGDPIQQNVSGETVAQPEGDPLVKWLNRTAFAVGGFVVGTVVTVWTLADRLD